MDSPRVRDVVAACQRLWPAAWAESWDSVGLAVGQPEVRVESILCALDPVDAVIAEAREAGADFLFTHHPLLLRGVTSVAADTLKGGQVTELIEAGIAAFNAHTNADSAVGGVSDVLADAIGLRERRPLAPTAGAPVGVGIGRAGALPEPLTVRQLAEALAEALAPTATGVRVAGDPEARIETAAVLGGSGDSLFDEVRAAGSDVYITSDLRHHPASEARDTAHRGAGTPHLIDISHWAAEALWLPRAAAQLADALAGDGFAVRIELSAVRSDPWDLCIGQPGFA
ncbi:Nif3-like dinuclear metal center hexameric protein [Brevibacterium sp. 5221]|uniref:GTP cyclohydrolase 1 type 2 homolog n=1 Tax=Brevibacterium rongguiense TaxID=2695267 RepID=A0A6N9H4L6_9MICO|nr:Nif3-like dinuclear metal center hexameric protein [Brevibacterium rongguiense]MYM18998.1 Nif3-like dinuclear metal center hexameric protein [Brevibacterium rongguiense]